jgi:hypothetical protein
MITDQDIKKLSAVFVTKEDLKDQLKPFVTKKYLKDQLKPFVTKKDLKNQLKSFATKVDLKEATGSFSNQMKEMGASFDRSVGMVFEEFTSQSTHLAELIMGIDQKLDKNLQDHEERIARLELKVTMNV